jgi:hypothetical protein
MARDNDDANRSKDELDRQATNRTDRDRDDRQAAQRPAGDESPGSKLHFGSAGSGGAEFEPIPDKKDDN